MDRMHWLVSFDLTPHSIGVVRLAQWLGTRTGGRCLMQGVHVDDRSILGLHGGEDGELAAGPDLEPTRQQALAFLEQHDVLEAFESVEVRLGAPVEVLQTLARERSVDGLLLGRAAPVGRTPLVALGTVPRRLLRQPTVPSVVVPPNLDPATLGRGPLLCGVDPSPYCLEAIAFARRLGRALSVEVLLVHAMPRETSAAVMGALSVEPRDPTMASGDLVPPQDTSQAERSIERWIEEHALHDLPLELRRGPIAATLRNAGREHAATMIVCGTRRLTLTERVLTASVGSDVAAHAFGPVAIVPSPLEVA